MNLQGLGHQKFLDNSDLQVSMKHEFSETFERNKFDLKFVGKGYLHYMKLL